jgi:hypothetical protein
MAFSGEITYQGGTLAGGFFLLCMFSSFLSAQTPAQGPIPDRYHSLSQNSITSVSANGSYLWTGPGLNRVSDANFSVQPPSSDSRVFSGDERVFSIASDSEYILAGLGHISQTAGEPVQAAGGYYLSRNAGKMWEYIPFPLDDSAPDNCTPDHTGSPCDLLFQYGDETYKRTRITVAEQSPPFDVALHHQTLFSANWASGLLRSTNYGTSWVRIPLPTSNSSGMSPDNPPVWLSQTPGGETVHRYDPRFDLNLLAFSVLIDSQGRVWTGTAAGLNISDNALYAPADQIRWHRKSWQPDKPDGLLSDWITVIREHPGTNHIWMNNRQTDPDGNDRQGLVMTKDGGETFTHHLEGLRINDIGFWHDAIVAAANEGLFINRNNGELWNRISPIESVSAQLRPDARFFAVGTTHNHLWVGTDDGLIATADGGKSWDILRVNLPLSGGNIYQPDAPDVAAYAYPNPFSPRLHTVARIKFEAEAGSRATVRMMDFGMNPVQTWTVTSSTAGSYEVSWDGTDRNGRTVADGIYFYTIEQDGARTDGKILVIE